MKDHHYWHKDTCRVCGCTRFFFEGAGKYYYLPKADQIESWSGSFEMPKCVEGEDKDNWMTSWWVELIVVLLLCVCLYFIVSAVEDWRTDLKIKQEHSRLTEENLKDTI